MSISESYYDYFCRPFFILRQWYASISELTTSMSYRLNISITLSLRTSPLKISSISEISTLFYLIYWARSPLSAPNSSIFLLLFLLLSIICIKLVFSCLREVIYVLYLKIPWYTLFSICTKLFSAEWVLFFLVLIHKLACRPPSWILFDWLTSLKYHLFQPTLILGN